MFGDYVWQELCNDAGAYMTYIHACVCALPLDVLTTLSTRAVRKRVAYFIARHGPLPVVRYVCVSGSDVGLTYSVHTMAFWSRVVLWYVIQHNRTQKIPAHALHVHSSVELRDDVFFQFFTSRPHETSGCVRGTL